MSSRATRSKSKRTAALASIMPLLEFPDEILSQVLATLDAASLLRASTSCKKLQALEVQARDELWRRLTLDAWPVAASYGPFAQMTWRGRYKYFVVRTAERAPPRLEEGEVLTVEQLNQRFEFFIEIGRFPHHSVHGDPPEHPNVSLHLKMDSDGYSLIPRDDDTPAKLMLELDKDVSMDVMVRRISDGAVAVLFHGSIDEDSWDLERDPDELGLVSFGGGSQWDPCFDEEGDLDGLERMNESGDHRGEYAPGMSCTLAIEPVEDEDGEEDLSQPGTFVWAGLEISTSFRGERQFDLERPTMSRLLTSKDLMVWEQYD